MREAVDAYMSSSDMLGLFLLAPEGINATVAGTEIAVNAFKELAGQLMGVGRHSI